MAISVGTVETHDAGTGLSSADVTISGSTVDAGSNRMVVVMAGKSSNASTAFTDVKINAVSCTSLKLVTDSTHALEVWYMLEADLPSAGTYDIVIDRAATHRLGAVIINLSGVDQTTPFDTADEQVEPTAGLDLTVSSDATQLVMDWFAGSTGDSNTVTVDGDQTERANFVGAAGAGSNSTRIAAGTGVGSASYAANLTWAGPGQLAHYAVPVNAAAAASGSTLGGLVGSNTGLIG